MHIVEWSETALNKLEKIEKLLQKRIKSKVETLSFNLDLGKYLFKSKTLNLPFWELKINKPPFRVYYTVKKDFIVIEDIEYQGRVRITDMGTKNQQKRVLKKYK